MKNRRLNGLFVATVLTTAIVFGGMTQNVQANEKITKVSMYTKDKAVSNDLFSSKLDNARAQQQILAETIYNTTFNGGKLIPGIENANGLYTVYSLARAEFKADDFYAAVYEKISAQLSILNNNGQVYDEINDEYISQQSILSGGYASQTYAKIALCVEALGRNIDDVGGFNLVEKLVSRDIYNSSNIYSRETMILFAIDAMNCVLPSGDEFLTRAELVNIIADDVDNQINNSVLWGIVDSAAMAIQPLAPYTTKEIEGVDKEAVIKACDRAMDFIKSMQQEDGTYGDSYSPSNVWSLSQVMFTAGVFNCDILSGDDFIKNNVTLFDAAAAFVDMNDKKVDETLMSFQPEQLLRGINACIRSADKVNSLPDTSDAAYVAADASKIAITANMISPISAKNYTGEKITPELIVKNGSSKLVKDKDYTLVFKNNKKIGTATVIITGKGNYILSQKLTFKIKMAKAVINSVSFSKKNVIVNLKKIAGAKKYKIEASANKNFTSAKVKTASSNKLKLTGLKSGKKYFIRAMAYSGSDKGAYSKVVSIKIP